MNFPLRLALSCAAASLLLLAAPAWAQDDAAQAAPPQKQDDNTQGSDAAATAQKLPGVAVERNVFVPVDSAGHSMGNQYIVIERRVLTKDSSGGDSGEATPADVPTHLILVPQDSEDDSEDAPSK